LEIFEENKWGALEPIEEEDPVEEELKRLRELEKEVVSRQLMDLELTVEDYFSKA
jgi:hypothetical protein